MRHLLNDHQLDILADVAFFHYLTAAQLQRLRFHDGKKPRYAQGRFLLLRKLELVAQVNVRISTRDGKDAAIWKLAKKALPQLRSIGINAQVPSEERAGALVFLLHHLLVNDFLIAAVRLTKADPAITLTQIVHDRELKRTQPYMVIDGVKRQCVPDGFVQFRRGEERFPVALEVDRDTEKPFLWKLKVRKLIAWAEGPYQAFSGTNRLAIAVVVQGRTPERSAERLKLLVAWTRDELKARGKEQRGALFLFTTALPTSMTATAYFTDAHWQTPVDSDSCYPLIEPRL